jgi:hypothetical protein
MQSRFARRNRDSRLTQGDAKAMPSPILQLIRHVVADQSTRESADEERLALSPDGRFVLFCCERFAAK